MRRGASSKKKKGSSGSHPIGAQRARTSASSSVASASASASASSSSHTPHPAYFPRSIEAAREKAAHGGGGRGNRNGGASRSRAQSISMETTAFSGDPFSVIRQRHDSHEPHMQQANLVLSAINSILLQHNIDATQTQVNPTHYFGTLMVLLGERRAAQSVETIGATLYLLQVLLPQLPKAVIRTKCEAMSEILIEILNKNATEKVCVQHLVECAAYTLNTVITDLPVSAWTTNGANASSYVNTTRLLSVLLVYSLDARPPIRRAARDGVKECIKTLYEWSIDHASTSSTGEIRFGLPKPVNEMILQFCLREISQASTKDTQVVNWLCGLLQPIIQYLSVTAAGKIMEALISMVGRGNSILMVQTMRTIDSFFINASDIHLNRQSQLPSTSSASLINEAQRVRTKFLFMSSQLLNVLLKLQPHSNDALATEAYLTTIKVALVQLTAALESYAEEMTVSASSTVASSSTNLLDTLRTCYSKIPDLLQVISSGLLSDRSEVIAASTKAMSEILKKAVTKKMIVQSLQEAKGKIGLTKGKAQAQQAATPFHRLIHVMENLLIAEYKGQWNRILVLCSDLIHSTSGNQEAQTLLIPFLQKLDHLRTQSQLEIFTEDPTKDYRAALDEAIGACVETFGMENVMKVLPLGLPTEYYNSKSSTPLSKLLESSRSWLLPIFRSHASPCDTLEFFMSELIPISIRLHENEKDAQKAQLHSEAKTFNTLKLGIWEIFPSLCVVLPTDLHVTFKKSVKQLAKEYLSSDEMIWTHSMICKGLGAIVRKLREVVGNGQTMTRNGDEQNEEEDEEDDEAKATFDEDDEDGSDGDDDDGSDDETAMEKYKTKLAAKKQQKKNQQSPNLQTLAASASTPVSDDETADSSSPSSRRPSNYTSATASSLLYSTIIPESDRLLKTFLNLAAMSRHEQNKEIIYESITQYASIIENDALNTNFHTALSKLVTASGELMKLREKIAEVKEAQRAKEEAMNDEDGGSSSEVKDDSEDQVGAGIKNLTLPQKLDLAQQKTQYLYRITDLIHALSVNSSSRLSEKNINLLYQLVSNVLTTQIDGVVDSTLQKKLYKMLALLIETPIIFAKFKSEMLKYDGAQNECELITLLETTSLTTHMQATRSRLFCLRPVLMYAPYLLVKGKKDAVTLTLSQFLGEIILATKQVKEKTRDDAFKILIDLGKKMIEVQEERKMNVGYGTTMTHLFGGLQDSTSSDPLLAEYIYMIAGSLAGKAHMQSASLLCLARMIYEFKSHLLDEKNIRILTELFETVLPLFDQPAHELIKSLLIFIKVCILTLPLPFLEQQAPSIVKGLIQWCTVKKGRFKLKIKILFEILMKKLGVEFIQSLVPQEHTALIDHIRKTKEREKRQSRDAWNARHDKKEEDEEMNTGVNQKKRQDYDAIMEDAMTDDTPSSAMAAAASSSSSKRMSAKDANALWIRDQNIDLLDQAGVMSKVTSSNPMLDAQRQQQAKQRAQLYGNGVTQDSKTGKIRIGESTSAMSAASSSSAQAAASAMLDIEELQSELKSKQRAKRKDRDEGGENEEEGDSQVQKKQHLPGSQYRSTKAGGDMHRPGQLAPHAFLPLNPLELNKRKKVTVQRRMASIVNAAKTGIQAGQKQHSAHSRSRKNKSHKKHTH